MKHGGKSPKNNPYLFWPVLSWTSMQFYRYSYSSQSTTTKNEAVATNWISTCFWPFFTQCPCAPLEVRTRLVTTEWWYQIKLVLQEVVLDSAVWYWICKGWTAPDLTPIDQSASRIIAEQVIEYDSCSRLSG